MREEIIGPHRLILGDCREILPTLGRVDAVVTDPPYGMIDHAWDVVVDPRLWMVAEGAVCFAAEPFATALINTSPLPFKYDLVWVKNTSTNMENADIRPGRSHERVLIFGNLTYTPQMRMRSADEMARLNATQRQSMLMSNPGSVLTFDAVNNRSGERTEHPSQKPLGLMSWLLKSYGAGTVLDPFMGSGTTGVACAKLGRRFIGVEREERYFDIACRRIEAAMNQPDLFIEQPKVKPEQFAMVLA